MLKVTVLSEETYGKTEDKMVQPGAVTCTKERKQLARNQQSTNMGRCKGMKTFVHQHTQNKNNKSKTIMKRWDKLIISNNMLQFSGTLSDDEYSSSMLESSVAYKDSCDPVRLESKPPSSVPVQTHFSCSSNNAALSSGMWRCINDRVIPYILNKRLGILYPC